MALTQSVDKVDESGREILTYGTEYFPIAFFDDDLTKVAGPPHWHDELELINIIKGKVHVRIAGSEFLLSAGEGYFANSGILHAADLLYGSGHQHAMVFSPHIISFGDDLVWKTCVDPVLNNPHIPFVRLTKTTPWHQELLTMAENAWQIGAYEKKDYPIHVRHLLSQCLALIASHAETIGKESSYTDKYQKDELRIKKALLYIERNYGSAVMLEEIAASASVSTSTCLRLFSAIVGTTPVNYLMNCRLQKAAEELQHQGKRTISEIAYLCGFADASYFNRCFRKKYGITPTEYVRLCKE